MNIKREKTKRIFSGVNKKIYEQARILIFFLTFLISISFVCSITDDFVVVSDNYGIDVCRCGMEENIIKIGNTGDIDNMYSVHQVGEAEKFSILSEAAFSIDGGKVKEIIDVINVPCDTKTGEYELETYVTSAFGLKKALKQIINVKKCVIRIKVNDMAEEEVQEEKKGVPSEEITDEKIKGFSISLPKREDEICGGEKTTYNVAVRSEDAVSVELSLNGPEWARLGWMKAIELKDNDEFNVDLIMGPESDEKGKEEMYLIAKNSEGVMIDKTSIIIDVVPQDKCNKINVLTDEIVLNQSDKNVNIEIENIGDKEGEFYVVVDGPQWIATEKIVQLGGEESRNISLDLSLDESVENGKYEANVYVKKGDKTIYSKNIDLFVGEKKFDIASFFLSSFIVVVIVVLIIAGIVLINRREQEEVRDIRIEMEEEKPKKSSNKAAAIKRVKKKKSKKKR